MQAKLKDALDQTIKDKKERAGIEAYLHAIPNELHVSKNNAAVLLIVCVKYMGYKTLKAVQAVIRAAASEDVRKYYLSTFTMTRSMDEALTLGSIEL